MDKISSVAVGVLLVLLTGQSLNVQAQQDDECMLGPTYQEETGLGRRVTCGGW